MTAPRVLVYSNQDEPLFELDPSHLHEMKAVEAINGEHSLTVTTTQRLDKMQRLLTIDETGKAREYVVTGVDEEHQEGRRLVGTYYAVWSLQHDLSGIYTTSFPGYDDDGGVAASTALGLLLENTSRWSVGTVTQATYGMASFYYLSGWKALSELVNVWGGEVDAAITVGATGVVSRSVCLCSRQGSTEAVRRFDYGADLTGIRRKVSDDVVTPRVLPLGKSEGVNGIRLGIADVNGGVPYIQDDESAALYRVPDGSGGWEYPVQVIVNDECEWPEQLMEWAEEVKEQYTRPKVTYEASVAQLVAAGMDAHGLSLGDTSHVVDRTFGNEGLRISGRVVKLEIDQLEPSNTIVTLGYLSDGLSGVLGGLTASINEVKSSIGYLSTAAYLDALLKRINDEINATGGWAYIVPGEGIVTYDKEVADPLTGMAADGTYATQVVQIKGGSIRIANTKKAQFSGINDWNWRTVFRSGMVATEVLTATNIVTGIIEDAANKQNPGTGNYWNLDTGEFRMGGKTASQIASDAVSALDKSLDQEEVLARLLGDGQGMAIDPETGDLYISASLIKSGIFDADLVKAGVLTDKAGLNYWNMVTGEFSLSSAALASIASNTKTSLTQREVYNKLTQNGAKNAIVMDENGNLYINASLINSGVLQVSDSSGNVLFKADIGTRLVSIGGFTVDEDSLYNGPSSLSSRTLGTYIGNDGISSSDGSSRVTIANGIITGYQGSTYSGSIDPTASVNEVDAQGNSTGVTRKGLRIRGGILEIRTNRLAVLDSMNEETTSRIAPTMTETFTRWGDLSVNANGTVTGDVETVQRRFVHGIFLYETVTREKTNKTIALKSYVDNGLSGKADSSHNHSGVYAPYNHSHSGYASSSHTHTPESIGAAAASHSHSYSSLTGKPSIPTFSRDGTVLTITT